MSTVWRPARVRGALVAGAALVVLAGVGGCVSDDATPPTGNAPGATTGGELSAEHVSAHLIDNGARRARSDHPGGYWFRGDLTLPAGGPTCAVAGITTGSHAPLVVDAVYDATGTVSVRIRAAERDRPGCLDAARRALAGAR